MCWFVVLVVVAVVKCDARAITCIGVDGIAYATRVFVVRACFWTRGRFLFRPARPRSPPTWTPSWSLASGRLAVGLTGSWSVVLHMCACVCVWGVVCFVVFLCLAGWLVGWLFFASLIRNRSGGRGADNLLWEPKHTLQRLLDTTPYSYVWVNANLSGLTVAN